MTTIDATLRDALGGAGDDVTLTLDPAFQGLPDAAHGGSVLGLFDLLASRRDRRTVRGRYLRRVPLGAPLVLTLRRDADGLACRVAEPGGGAVLVDGGVGVAHLETGAPAAVSSGSPAPLPASLTCVACWLENPRGLRAQLAFDAGAVTGTWAPRPGFVGDDGRLSPIALTTLLDEAAFWLGALASGESGMTTDLVVTLHGDA